MSNINVLLKNAKVNARNNPQAHKSITKRLVGSQTIKIF